MRAQHNGAQPSSLPESVASSLWQSRAVVMAVAALYSTNYGTTKIVQAPVPPRPCSPHALQLQPLRRQLGSGGGGGCGGGRSYTAATGAACPHPPILTSHPA
jgi:hypothetical protein